MKAGPLPPRQDIPRFVSMDGDPGSRLLLVGETVMGSEATAASDTLAACASQEPAAAATLLRAAWLRLREEVEESPIEVDHRPAVTVGLSLALALLAAGDSERAVEVLRELAPLAAVAYGTYAMQGEPKVRQQARRARETALADLRERIRRLEGKMPEPLVAASFASREGFLGVVVVAAREPQAALAKINALGMNPGGEVLMYPVPPECPYPRDRLLSLADLTAAAEGFPEWAGAIACHPLTPEEVALRRHRTVLICEDDNGLFSKGSRS